MAHIHDRIRSIVAVAVCYSSLSIMIVIIIVILYAVVSEHESSCRKCISPSHVPGFSTDALRQRNSTQQQSHKYEYTEQTSIVWYCIDVHIENLTEYNIASTESLQLSCSTPMMVMMIAMAMIMLPLIHIIHCTAMVQSIFSPSCSPAVRPSCCIHL